jgi:hypothetical protein
MKDVVLPSKDVKLPDFSKIQPRDIAEIPQFSVKLSRYS